MISRCQHWLHQPAQQSFTASIMSIASACDHSQPHFSNRNRQNGLVRRCTRQDLLEVDFAPTATHVIAATTATACISIITAILLLEVVRMPLPQLITPIASAASSKATTATFCTSSGD